jgi:hypothetical protein
MSPFKHGLVGGFFGLLAAFVDGRVADALRLLGCISELSVRVLKSRGRLPDPYLYPPREQINEQAEGEIK